MNGQAFEVGHHGGHRVRVQGRQVGVSIDLHELQGLTSLGACFHIPGGDAEVPMDVLVDGLDHQLHVSDVDGGAQDVHGCVVQLVDLVPFGWRVGVPGVDLGQGLEVIRFVDVASQALKPGQDVVVIKHGCLSIVPSWPPVGKRPGLRSVSL